MSPEEVVLPPYFPDTHACRLDWAGYLDAIEAMDSQVGEILDRLDEEGLRDETVVIFMGDNGRCHLRGKCWLYDGGIRVPLVIRYLEDDASPRVDDGLHSTLDVTATILQLADAAPPEVFDGRPLIGPNSRPREVVFSARDLIDEVRDPIRAVRTKRYKYIRNYRPELGYGECEYVQQNRPMLPVIRRLAAADQLSLAQQLVIAKRKPPEELYDLEKDPHELFNLIDDPDQQEMLHRLRSKLDSWIAETIDTGLSMSQQPPSTSAVPASDSRKSP